MLRCIVVWLKACLYLDGGELWRIHQSAEHFTHPLLNRVRDRCHGTSGSRGHCLFDAKHLSIGSAHFIRGSGLWLGYVRAVVKANQAGRFVDSGFAASQCVLKVSARTQSSFGAADAGV